MLPANTLLNINVPARPAEQIKGVRLALLAQHGGFRVVDRHSAEPARVLSSIEVEPAVAPTKWRRMPVERGTTSRSRRRALTGTPRPSTALRCGRASAFEESARRRSQARPNQGDSTSATFGRAGRQRLPLHSVTHTQWKEKLVMSVDPHCLTNSSAAPSVIPPAPRA